MINDKEDAMGRELGKGLYFCKQVHTCFFYGQVLVLKTGYRNIVGIMMDCFEGGKRLAKLKKLSLILFLCVISTIMTIVIAIFYLPNRQVQDQHPKQFVKKQDVQYVYVYLSKENRVIQLPLETYLVGVVAAEMPADFHMEALKAQSLAARTYIIRRLKEGKRLDPNEWGQAAKDADVSDTVQHQVYLTDQALQKRWGKEYSWKMKRVRQAVKATEGMIITYNRQPIYAAFFSTSNGWTEDSEDYFQNAYPYLRSVSSEWDRESPKYLHRIKLPISKVVRDLERSTGKPITVEAAARPSWIRVLEKTEGRRIAKVIIGDQIFTGRQVREALQLPSSDFTWKITSDSVLFETRGYGHGVGMSQWGANLMAKRGKKMKEIIEHYYRNVEIVQWSSMMPSFNY